MYFFFLILLLFVLTGFIFFHKRKKKICRKICSMNFHEKCKTLTELITPFGFCYDSKQDIFSTTLDAWQREFGYTEKYNKLAPYFNMVFDYEPVYFDYNNRTWLIEFWKGQYGINTGCEVGIYYSESIISPDMRNTTLFHCVKDNDMLPISIQLIRDACTLGIIQKKHWWLTVFDVGKYCEPSRLSIPIEITFPNKQMLYSFTQALLEKGYSHNQIYIYNTTIHLLYNSNSTSSLPLFRHIICRFSQWKNRIFCRLYLWITKPYCTSLDRVLYLYYYIPFAFRRLLTIKHYKKTTLRH